MSHAVGEEDGCVRHLAMGFSGGLSSVRWWLVILRVLSNLNNSVIGGDTLHNTSITVFLDAVLVLLIL